eukprot:scaffold100762_cov18-Tisochrysis_lutea.AAC.2
MRLAPSQHVEKCGYAMLYHRSAKHPAISSAITSKIRATGKRCFAQQRHASCAATSITTSFTSYFHSSHEAGLKWYASTSMASFTCSCSFPSACGLSTHCSSEPLNQGSSAHDQQSRLSTCACLPPEGHTCCIACASAQYQQSRLTAMHVLPLPQQKRLAAACVLPLLQKKRLTA